MRITFQKLTGQRHQLELVRHGGVRERIECETRSLLFHDFLHYVVESEADVRDGFWGSLAAGRTLAEMNQRETDAERALGMRREMAPNMAIIERVVGAMSGITKGQSPADLVASFRRFSASLGTDVPAWLTEPMMRAAAERMRRLIGEWRALRTGQSLTLDWPRR